jgi:poly(3-hydroxybutyrate) depolymerase
VSNDITVSGLSSGGFMTVQLHVAFSSIFKGAAVFAGGPFYCAEDGAKSEPCTVIGHTEPDTAKLIEYTKQFESEGKIDPSSNLYDDQTFVWMGKYDTVVGRKVTLSLEDYYRNFVDNSRLHLDHTFPAQHCLPTLSYGEECTKLRPPFIGSCGYDGAGDAFQHLYGTLNPSTDPVIENLWEFDQTSYIPTDNPLNSVGEKGFIYVPTACKDGSQVCRLHFSFHGCLQTGNN